MTWRCSACWWSIRAARFRRGLDVLLLANPTDVYRIVNLAGFANVSSFSGMAGLAGSATLSPAILDCGAGLMDRAPVGPRLPFFARREL